jgi:uroporphyrinogen-III decarboxylase
MFFLKDIRKWRDVVKLPSLDDFDWEGEAKKSTDTLDGELKKNGLDRTMVATELVHMQMSGYFMTLTYLMGMTEALCALLEEPEEVKELFSYLSDFNVTIAKNTLKYFKPDVLYVSDDTATASNPFMSRKVWQDLIMPFHARVAKLARDEGIPVMMHCCGRCEDFIEDWVEFGVSAWNPAQVMNDLAGIKKKYGNKLTLIGCWDSSGPASWAGSGEELVRQAVRDCIDRYAAGGGFMFMGDIIGPADDQDFENRRRWMTTEYEAYRDHPYK